MEEFATVFNDIFYHEHKKASQYEIILKFLKISSNKFGRDFSFSFTDFRCFLDEH